MLGEGGGVATYNIGGRTLAQEVGLGHWEREAQSSEPLEGGLSGASQFNTPM